MLKGRDMDYEFLAEELDIICNRRLKRYVSNPEEYYNKRSEEFRKRCVSAISILTAGRYYDQMVETKY